MGILRKSQCLELQWRWLEWKTYPDPDGPPETLAGRVFMPLVWVLGPLTTGGKVTTDVRVWVSWLVILIVLSKLGCEGPGGVGKTYPLELPDVTVGWMAVLPPETEGVG
jgi:hypothetical protein